MKFCLKEFYAYLNCLSGSKERSGGETTQPPGRRGATSFEISTFGRRERLQTLYYAGGSQENPTA